MPTKKETKPVKASSKASVKKAAPTKTIDKPKAKATKTTKKTLDKKVVKKDDVKKAKKTTETTKKVTKKTSSTTAIKKAPKKTAAKKAPKVKKMTKKMIKELEIKELNAKTSAKIFAKAKSNSNKAKVIEAEPEVVEKKNDSQKNLIIVKKLSESRSKVTFKVDDYVIYPSHGVGKIIEIEKTKVLGQDLSCYLMLFEKEKLVIKIPTDSAEKIGLRHLVSKPQMDEVFSTLRSGIKKLKGMWSRRAQEYETKINSGDIMLLAEVLRDLTRDIEDGERSYSERIIYETAVHRLAAEYSVIYGIEFEEAKEKIISTAKDKLGIEGKIIQKDEFDEFDYDDENDSDEDEEEEDEDEDEDDD